MLFLLHNPLIYRMQHILSKWLFLLLCSGILVSASFAQSNSGYQIGVEMKPYKNQWLYLAYYYGSIKGLADSAYLNENSKGVFKGSKPLPQGVYIIASPNKTILVEMLVGPDQQFSLSADTTALDATIRFEGSKENDEFVAYTAFIAPRARRADSLRNAMDKAAPEDKKTMQADVQRIGGEITNYRKGVIDKQPESLLGLLFQSMREIEYPAALQHAKTRQDTMNQYRYGKEHFWDGVDFMDGRLPRTPIFEAKLKDYLENWVSPESDSVIYEFNWMIALGRNDEEMFKYLIGYFVDHYMYPRIMGQDKVFLHVYENYLAGEKPKANWLNEKQMKIIRERAYMLMANQLGTKAWDMELVDTTGKVKSLYQVQGDYTIVVFWDVHCGKCKEEIPKMDTLYRTKWKQKNVKVYAVMVNESSVPDWKPFIRKSGAGWVHVHQTDAMRAQEEKAGKPNFRQLYDMRSTPTLFLLDKDKKIIAKSLSLPDLEKLLEQKFAQQAKAK